MRWIVLVLLAGCPPFDAEGPYRCDDQSDCLSSERCNAGICAPACEPKQCTDFAGRCGEVLDECGGTIECTCAAPLTCGGGGRNGFCGCMPRECEVGTCGAFDDGCGATIECGCTAPDTCGGGGIDGRCGCTAKDCDGLGLDCGLASDGCTETIWCGGCEWPDDCGADADNRCGKNSACAEQNAACGFLGFEDYCGSCAGGDMCGVPDANSCGRPATCLAEGRQCGFSEAMPGVWCGGCAIGEMCEAAACVPAVRPFCWGPEERIGFLELEWKTAPVAELGRLMLYGEVKVPGDEIGCSRLGRVPLLDHTTLATTTFELLDSSDFSGLELSGCRDNPNIDCEGRVGRPDVRADGLEMFFESNYRCAELEREIYLSFRRSPTEPWSLPILLPISTYDANTNDSVDRPLLLPDHQTLIHRDATIALTELGIARRSTSIPGDAAFRRMGTISIEDPPPEGELRTVRPQAVSCDGRYLLYYRETAIGQRLVHEARLIEIRSLEPLTFGSPAAYDGVEDRFTFGESPDCNALYYAGGAFQYVKRRVACP